MSRKDLITNLKKKNSKLNNLVIEKILDNLTETIRSALIQGRSIEIRGFGSFRIKRIKEKYNARNPKTGKYIYVPEKNKVKFKASKNLNDIINR